jgi:hypothetical protein
MGELRVQGIVSAEHGLPLIQFRQLDDEGNEQAGWQLSPEEARDTAQMIVEAAANAVYDAALYAWAKEAWPDEEEPGWKLIDMVRRFRADKWGLPDRPEDWRPDAT